MPTVRNPNWLHGIEDMKIEEELDKYSFYQYLVIIQMFAYYMIFLEISESLQVIFNFRNIIRLANQV